MIANPLLTRAQEEVKTDDLARKPKTELHPFIPQWLVA